MARLTEHVEIARESYGAVIMFVQTFLITAVSVVLGLAALDPALLVLVLPPLLTGLGIFLSALRAMAARQRAVVLADERLAETVSAAAGGLRDVVACGAEERVATQADDRIDASVRAARALARLTALRTAVLGISGWVPLLLILAGTPWLVRSGVTAGAILGAVAYVSQGLQPALQDFVRGMAGSGLWLAVSLARITEAARITPDKDEGAGAGTGARKQGDQLGEPEIAHRISSALRADLVLVLDGTRARLGTHEELMAASALYRDLVGHWDAAAPPPSSQSQSQSQSPAATAHSPVARTG
ncbi:hypothetical protein ABZX62_02310 [Streptomyces flavidovirens]|uniref:hypothetical protein n=1 Tax=Streptomyces flavidovirens TaxID=67298 RepID=UPI0033A459A9